MVSCGNRINRHLRNRRDGPDSGVISSIFMRMPYTFSVPKPWPSRNLEISSEIVATPRGGSSQASNASVALVRPWPFGPFWNFVRSGHSGPRPTSLGARRVLRLTLRTLHRIDHATVKLRVGSRKGCEQGGYSVRLSPGASVAARVKWCSPHAYAVRSAGSGAALIPTQGSYDKK